MELPNLLTQQDMADLFQVSHTTIDEYEKQGIIQRVKGIPSKRYNPQQIALLIGLDKDTFSPYLLKKAQKELAEANNTILNLEHKLETIKKVIGG